MKIEIESFGPRRYKVGVYLELLKRASDLQLTPLLGRTYGIRRRFAHFKEGFTDLHISFKTFTLLSFDNNDQFLA